MPRNSNVITKVCAHCGETFTRPDWKVWRVSMYCSGDCYTSARRALNPDERAALMANATAQIRGHKRSHDDLCKRAQGKQRTAKLSEDEAAILSALYAAELSPVVHFAVDKYNIDFAFPDVKVGIEYNGGNWHNTPKKITEDERKISYLEGEGWTIMVFPRIDKPQANNAGNRRIAIDEIVRQVKAALYLAKSRAA